ncbi:MAG: MFS transporter [Deltaproteobacteria bacterium]|nr:MAG: MFS transporter [Deltaproteobacteria bacterium]
MVDRLKGPVVLAAGCVAIFWPGALIFGFPGVMSQHWQHAFQVGRAEVGQILFYVLAAVGIFMFLVGRWQERIGPSSLTVIGTVLCGTGIIMVGHASGIKIVYVWAFITGVSSAFVYLPVLSAGQRWYPHRRGLISGVVNMFFGLSAAIMVPTFSRLLNHEGHTSMTLTLGELVLIIGLPAAVFVRFPERLAPSETVRAPQSSYAQASLSVKQSLRTRSYWFLWFTWAFAGAAGISMVTLSPAFGISKNLPIGQAVLMLTAFNITNGLSRLVSGYLSDIIGRNKTMSLAFLLAGGAYVLLPHLEGIVRWATLTAIIGFAFGTLFAVSAPLVADCFGMDHFGTIFGLVFTAYGFVSGIIGPWLCGHLLDITRGNFTLVFSYLGSLMLISAILVKMITPRSECS